MDVWEFDSVLFGLSADGGGDHGDLALDEELLVVLAGWVRAERT